LFCPDKIAPFPGAVESSASRLGLSVSECETQQTGDRSELNHIQPFPRRLSFRSPIPGRSLEAGTVAPSGTCRIYRAIGWKSLHEHVGVFVYVTILWRSAFATASDLECTCSSA
jgi:hypothetical protein